MDLMGGRVSLSPRPALAREPALEVGMLGHLPGQVRLERLRPSALVGMRAAGWGEALAHFADLAVPRLADADIERVRALYHVPVPLNSSAELDDLFPQARTLDTGYRSALAGARAWLPRAVDDFFANGGERLWLVRVPETESRMGFRAWGADAPPPVLPATALPLEQPLSLRGLAVLLAIPDVAVIAAPDLERLLIPSQLPDIPRLRLANPVPAFAPCGQAVGDDHRERRRGTEMPISAEADETLALVDSIRSVLAQVRPDIQYLHTLPLQYADAVQGPGIHAGVLDALESRRLTRAGSSLKRIQFLFPYLRAPRPAAADLGLAPWAPLTDLASPVGLVAGRQAAVARRDGVWRSIAGQALETVALPYPPSDGRFALRLRERPGVGVLVQRQGRVELEDERLAVPALHVDDYVDARDPLRFDGYRSGEIARFIGWLLRRLHRLGEALVFDLDPRDPRPRLLLEELFRRLHGAGALRGRVPEESFRIRPGQRAGNAIAYDIEIAPAFPIDRVRLTFANTDGEWRGSLLGAIVDG